MTTHTKKIIRIDQGLIASIIQSPELVNLISPADQAEMAIPSYLNKNPLVRAMFWRRYDEVYHLADLQTELTVCEFGCGIGAFLPTLAAEAGKVYAVDLFPQYASELARRLDLEVTFAEDMSHIPNGSLDLIIAVEVMEHLDEPVQCTRLFGEKLKPNGRLIISGPTESWLYKLGRFLVGYNKYHDYHQHDVYQLRRIIGENGFALQKTIRFPSPLLPLYLIGLYHVNQT